MPSVSKLINSGVTVPSKKPIAICTRDSHTRIHQCSETSAVKPTLTCHWAGICICFPVLFQAAGTNMWFCIFLGCALLDLSSSPLSLLIHFPAWAWTTSCPSDSDSRPCHLSLSGLDCPWMHIIVCAQLVSIDSWRLGLALADIFRRISRANGSHASAIRMASKQRALLHGSPSANAALFVIVIVVELSWVIHKIYSI